MKIFKFKYENLLKMRMDRVEGIKNQLGELNGLLFQANEHLTHVLIERGAYFERVQIMLEQGCKASDLRDVESSKKFYKAKIEDIHKQIAEIEKRIEQTQLELIEAMREQKIMEKLKEKDEATYMEAINHAENKVIDEIVNFQNFKKIGSGDE